MEIIPYGRQEISPEDIEAVVKVLKSDFLTQGPAVQEFEKSVTDFLKGISDQQSVHALAVNNGTSALQLACLALGVKQGDKVLVTSNSFVATSNCVLYAGGDVEFIDISLTNYCIDLDLLEKRLNENPKGTYKGVIATDFAGIPFDLKRMRQICDQHGLWFIEDACHAIGAQFRPLTADRSAAGDAKYADISVMSFHPVKHIATGEGGMILTRSKELYDRMTFLRTHGITKDPSKMLKHDGGWYYEMQQLGYNCRISDILCALGTSQMKRIESNLANRRRIASTYDQELKNLPLFLPQVSNDLLHSYHLYVIRVQTGAEERKKLYQHFADHKIYSQVHYIPIYQMPYYVERYGKQSLKNCDAYYDSCLSIPMFHSMSESQQARVIDVIRKFNWS